ncbi:MAG: hypothetical protein WA268_14550 [Xanthobacteraceae bacterium]
MTRANDDEHFPPKVGAGVPSPMSPEQFKTFIPAETGKWANLLKFANIKMD